MRERVSTFTAVASGGNGESYLVTRFPCRYDGDIGRAGRLRRPVGGEPASPATPSRRLMKRPTVQHGGAHMERDGCVTISRSGVYIYLHSPAIACQHRATFTSAIFSV